MPGGASKIASGHGAGYLRRGERAIFRAKFPRRGNFASPPGTSPKAALHRKAENFERELLIKDSFELFRECRYDVVNVADYTVGSYFEDWRIGVFIDGQYDF